jgi:hypothetical protein
MTVYLVFYFAVGIAVYATTRIRKDEADIRMPAPASNRAPWMQLANFLAINLLWPIVLAALVYEWSAAKPGFRRASPDLVERPAFRVRTEDLQRRMSIGEIESAEVIRDPLGAVPELPFGHLNRPWTRSCPLAWCRWCCSPSLCGQG